MSKTLKLWNGRGCSVRKHDDPIWKQVPSNGSVRIYAAAYSRADLRRLIAEYCGMTPSDNELKTYWSECWGIDMEGVVPERGLWFKYGYGEEKPIQIFSTPD